MLSNNAGIGVHSFVPRLISSFTILFVGQNVTPMVPVTAFSPGGITSFFQPYMLKKTVDLSSIDIRRAARGGGLTTRRGTTTSVAARRSRKNSVVVIINGRHTLGACTTETVAELLLKRSEGRFAVKVEHQITIPIGAGYGTSAAGALSTALALNELLDLGMTFDQAGFFAHAAEIRQETGLGTVGPLMVGGCVIQREGGPPGLCRIDRIPLKPSYRIISGSYGPISKPRVLDSAITTKRIGRLGGRTMSLILSEPNLKNFLQQSEEFALKIGFMTEKIKMLIAAAKSAGAIGATQNMLGEAFHAVVEEDLTSHVLKVLRGQFRGVKLFSTKIDFEGARLL
jgi:pantoate kinase